MNARPIFEEPSRHDVCVSALAGLLFGGYLVVLNVVATPSSEQWSAADPILGILPHAMSLWVVPAASLVAAVAWWRVARPDRATLKRGAVFAVIGLAVAIGVCGAIRLVHGPRLPAFVPPEESSAPGYLLSMTAGFGEEVIFRLALLPTVYFLARRHIARLPSVAIAALITGLGFALLHEAGPGVFELHYFVTRFLFPGCVMSIAWYANPTFLVVAHSAAHVLMPLLFASH